MFNLLDTVLSMPLDTRPRKAHGLVLVELTRTETGRVDRTGEPVMRIIMTHAPRGKVWPGPGITGSVRRAMQRGA